MIHYHRYLPWTEEMQGRDLSVLAAGYLVGDPGVSETYSRSRPSLPLPPHHPSNHHFVWKDGRVLSEYQLIYVTRGNGLFESQTCGLRHLAAGDFFALFPGEWHRYGPYSEHDPNFPTEHIWDIYWVAFVGKLAAEYMAECGLSMEEPVLKVGVDRRLIEEYLRLTDELRELSAGYHDVMAVRTLLILTLARAARLRRSEPSPEMVHIMERAKGLMLERIDRAPDLEQLAASLGMSYSWFRKLFRQHTEMSPAQYHLDYRIQRACDLLTNTDVPVTTIAASLGIEPAYYFARIFKQKTGCTPREYRARAQVPDMPG